MRVVVLTHYFPPITGPGSRRMLGWCNGMTGDGHEVVVVTPRPDPRDAYYEPQERYGGLANVIEVPIFDPSRWLRRSGGDAPAAGKQVGLGARVRPWLLLPDQRRLANGPLTEAAARVLRDGAILISSSPYNSVHLAGLALKRAFGHTIKWIADFRDDWFHPVFFPFPTGLHRWLNRRWEGNVLSMGDGLVAVSPDTLGRIRARHAQNYPESFWRHEPPGRWHVVHNGFDPTGVEDVLAAPVAPHPQEPYHILFSGTLWPDHPLEAFVQALVAVSARTDRRIRLELAGRIVQAVTPPPSASGVEIVVTPWRPYGDSLMQSRQADLLLVHTGPQSQDIKIKIFDCAAVQRPVFVIGPEDSQTVRLAREHIAEPLVAAQHDRAKMEALIERVILAQQVGRFAFAGLPPQYNRIEQARQLLAWAQALPPR